LHLGLHLPDVSRGPRPFFCGYHLYAKRDDQEPVDTDISTVPREGNTVPRRPSKEHTEHRSKSVHPWSATSKTKQAHVTCSHPASRTVDPRSCGNKCSVHVEVERRRTRRSTRRGWGGGAFAGGECGMERTLGVEKRSWRACVHRAGGKARQGPGAAVGRDGKAARGVGRQSGSVLRERWR